MAPLYGWTKTQIIPLLVDEQTALNDLLWITTLQYREARQTIHAYIEKHPHLHASKEWLKDIETLMHKTKQNPNPV